MPARVTWIAGVLPVGVVTVPASLTAAPVGGVPVAVTAFGMLPLSTSPWVIT